MLKTTGLPHELAPNNNDRSRLAFNRDNNSKLASRKNNGNDKVNRFGIGRNDVEYAKKSKKLSKLRKSKNEKIFKS